MEKKKITILGLGYVGLPLAVAIQKSKKYEVLGFDINQDSVDMINNKQTWLEDKTIKAELREFPLHATTDEKELDQTDIFIIAVPTPISADHKPNYGPVESASKTVARHMRKGSTVVLESTVNPGTCEEIVLPILQKISGLEGGPDFNLAHCPERINPGDPKWTLYNIPRNIGSLNEKRNAEIANFYRDFLDAEVNEVSSLKIAESTKIIENTFRDINIAYVNELAQSFDAMGIDLIETIEAASNKPFGYMPHWPGAGVGGHCIAVDPYYLIQRAAKANFDHKFLKVARDVNNSMPGYVISRLEQAITEAKLDKDMVMVGLLGLTYKPEVADERESPAIEILELLKNDGYSVLTFDPYLQAKSDVSSLEGLLKGTDIIVLATAHRQFTSLTAGQLQNNDIRIVVDGRNVLNKAHLIESGIIYKGIGR